MLRRFGRKVQNSSESRFSDSVFRQFDLKEQFMNVFVTGATGFIGSAIVRELLIAGHVEERSDKSAAHQSVVSRRLIDS